MFFDVSMLWVSLRSMGALRPTEFPWLVGGIGRPIHGRNPPFYPNAVRQITRVTNSAPISGVFRTELSARTGRNA